MGVGERATRVGKARWLFAIALATFSLAWAGILNRGPFWFPDTSAYIRGADGAVVALTGHKSEWSDHVTVNAVHSSGADSSADPLPPMRTDRVPLAGRSIYYGMIIYLMLELGGPWGALFGQSLLVGAILILCSRPALRALFKNGDAPKTYLWHVVGAITLASALTSLSFYTMMLMPDVFAGLGIMILVTLTVFGQWTLRWEYVLLTLCCCAILAFHSANIAISIGVGVCALLLGLTKFGPGFRQLWIYPIVLLAAGLSVVVYSRGVEWALGERPISPPFLTARLLAAGPGGQFLYKHCPAYQGPLCRFRHILPQDSDTLLWSESATNGIFMVANKAEKTALARGDTLFFFDVAKAYPAEVIAVSSRAILQLMGSFGLKNFNYSVPNLERFTRKLPTDMRTSMVRSRAAQGEMPVAAWSVLTILSTVGSLMILGGVLTKAIRRHDELIVQLVLLTLAGLLTNAVVCGALSKPHERYQMRLVWVLPLVAGLATGTRLRSRHHKKERP